MEIIKEQNENTVNIKVIGHVDSTNAKDFENQINVDDLSLRIVFDMENLEYITSAGLRAILTLRGKHSEMEVINTSPTVYETFDMTGFTQMMTVKRAYRTVSVEGCEIIGQGSNGIVYRIDPDTVVKVYKNPDSLDVIEHERDVARKALILGIPTAISYDVVKVGNSYASMFEMLNAKSFSKLLKANPEDVHKYAVMYVDLLKKIHSTEVPAGQLPDQKDVLMKWISDLNGQLPDNIYQKLYKFCEEVPHSNHMIHGDYHTKNLELQNDEVILIDMDTLAVGHPVLEFGSIYNAYIGFYALDHEAIKDFLGFDYETGLKLWNDTLRLYYGTEDENLLALYEKKAKTVGLIRLLRRSIRKNNDQTFIDYCKTELCKLAEELDTLL